VVAAGLDGELVAATAPPLLGDRATDAAGTGVLAPWAVVMTAACLLQVERPSAKTRGKIANRMSIDEVNAIMRRNTKNKRFLFSIAHSKLRRAAK
jgi:hypothetical protein